MRTFKRKLTSLALLCLLPICMSSCVYNHFTQPLDTDLDATVLGNKVGRSSFQSVLWTASWGDAGTQAAAEEGGISVIHHADIEILSILLGLYYRQTTILYGE